MSVQSIAPVGVFRVGDVLGRAWRIFTGNPLFFLGVPALIYAAILATFTGSVRLVGMASGDQRLAWASVGLAALIDFAVYTIGQAVVVIGALQRLGGEPLRVGAALRRSLANALPLIVLALLWSLGIGICLWAALFVVPLGIWQAGIGMLLAYALVPMALVPAAILFVMWSVAVPACVVEGLGPFASIRRSSNLTKGFRWKIFAILLPLAVLSLAGGAIEVMLSFANPVLSSVVDAAWLVVVMAFWNCTLIITYRALRVAKEGIDTGQVAAVFD